MKNNNKNYKNILLRTIALAATKSAAINANSSCAWWGYQSTLPDSVKKLRKF